MKAEELTPCSNHIKGFVRQKSFEEETINIQWQTWQTARCIEKQLKASKSFDLKRDNVFVIYLEREGLIKVLSLNLFLVNMGAVPLLAP